MIRAAVLLLVGLMIPVESLAQSSVVSASPRTKLEAFEAQTGAVIIRGFSEIGKLNGINGGSVTVEAREFINATTGRKESGLAITIRESRQSGGENTALIDYEEMPSLIKGLDYIAGINRSVTKLDDFHAVYQTKGDFVMSTSSSAKGILVSLSSGEFEPTSAVFKLADLAQIKDLMVNARTKLDSIR
jgi:hypothetical protein